LTRFLAAANRWLTFINQSQTQLVINTMRIQQFWQKLPLLIVALVASPIMI
jgi:hypothetical protein